MRPGAKRQGGRPPQYLAHVIFLRSYDGKTRILRVVMDSGDVTRQLQGEVPAASDPRLHAPGAPS